MTSNKQPEIRFPGFTQDWEQRKFADLFNRVKSYSLSRDVETKEETGVCYVHYGDIHTKVADKIDNQSKIPNINQGNFETLQKGDLILADASEDYQGIATPAVILESTRFDIVAGLHTIALRPKDANPLYLYYLINSEVFRKYGYRVGTGMKVFGISATNVLKFETLFPSYDEQKKVGAFFKQLDDAISLHQQELTVLKETKQGFLQKMFPKEGEKVPEIRFPGFTDDWEQRELSDVATIVGGGTPSTNNEEYWNGDIDWYSPAEIGEQRYVYRSRKKISELGLQKSSAKILPVGTVLFTSRAGIGNTAILAKEGATNQGFQSIIPKKEILDSYFIFSRTDELKRYGEVTGAGSTFVEVSGKQMLKMPILVPSLEEQKKIGTFFKQLDDTIALRQRELDLLKETKKAFLQKMFV